MYTQIVDINLQMPFNDFENALKTFKDNYSAQMDTEIKQLNTRMGKHMYKITITNVTSESCNIVAEQNDINGDIMFKPLKMQSLGESFYSHTAYSDSIIGTDNDPMRFLTEYLGALCQDNKGTIAFIANDGKPYVISNGNTLSHLSLAVVDSNNRVYSSSNAESVRGESSGPDFSIVTPIGEWIKDHADIGAAISALPLNEKMNYIGKQLIQMRLNDEIESDEFVDIFRQAGIFGFSDNSVLKIYKLIM